MGEVFRIFFGMEDEIICFVIIFGLGYVDFFGEIVLLYFCLELVVNM